MTETTKSMMAHWAADLNMKPAVAAKKELKRMATKRALSKTPRVQEVLTQRAMQGARAGTGYVSHGMATKGDLPITPRVQEALTQRAMQGARAGTGYVSHGGTSRMADTLRRHSQGVPQPMAGPKALSARSIAKAGLQAAIITEGFNQWDKLLTNPDTAIGAIQEGKAFFQDLQNMPADQRMKALGTMSADIAKEIGKNVQGASREAIEQGIGIARDLYAMDAQTRTQFLKDVYTGTVENLGNMAKSLKNLINLPMADKRALLQNLGQQAGGKGKALAMGAKKIYDAMSSR